METSNRPVQNGPVQTGPVVEKTEARAGETSGRMRIVLVASICLVVLVFAGLLVSWA